MLTIRIITMLNGWRTLCAEVSATIPVTLLRSAVGTLDACEVVRINNNTTDRMNGRVSLDETGCEMVIDGLRSGRVVAHPQTVNRLGHIFKTNLTHRFLTIYTRVRLSFVHVRLYLLNSNWQ